MHSCEFCNKEFEKKMSRGLHRVYCSKNPNAKPTHVKSTGQNQNTKAKRLGINIEVSQETRDKISKANLGRKHSPETIRKLRNSMRKAVLENPESYSAKNVCGRVKSYEHRGMTFLGKWELNVARALDQAGIEYTNNVKPFEYEWNSKTHLYFPDFYLPELDIYIEVKGYQRERDLCKWKAVENLVVFKKKEIDNLSESVRKLHQH